MMEISRRGPSRRSEIAPFLAMDMMAAAAAAEAAGRRVIHMEVGQPGTPAPSAARAAVTAALDQPLGYTVGLGLPQLRRRISQLYRDWHGLEIDPERIVVTTGSSGGFVLAFLTLFEAGERVALADPGYPSYRNILRALDLSVARLAAGRETRCQPTPELLEVAAADGPIAGVLAASPANPTGSVLDAPALERLCGWCRDHGAAFISDEIYHGLSYGAPAPCALAHDPDAIVINSFSKYFSMTGWRIGWMVVPERLVRTVERLAQSLFICAPHVSQCAALAALDAAEELDAYRAVYERNRAVLLEALPKAGLTEFAPPDGAFYFYAALGPLLRPGEDSQGFCARLLAEAGVATTTGVDFDPVRGGGTFRLSYAGPEADIVEGAARLIDFAQKG